MCDGVDSDYEGRRFRCLLSFSRAGIGGRRSRCGTSGVRRMDTRLQAPRLARNTAVLTASQVVGLISGLGASIILARALGPEGKGQFSLLQLVPALLYTAANLGLPGAVVYVSARNHSDRRSVLRQGLMLAAVAQAVVALIFVLLLPYIHDAFFPGVPRWALIGFALLSVPSAMAQIWYLRLLSSGKTVRASAISQAPQIGFAALLIPSALASQVSLALAAGLGIVTKLASSVAMGVAAREPRSPVATHPTSHVPSLLRFGLKAWASNALTFLNYRQDMLVVSFFLGASGVGLYSLAVTLVELLWYLPNAFADALFPKVTAIQAAEASRLTAQIVRLTTLVMAVEVVAIGVAAPFFVKWVFGAPFVACLSALYALLPGAIAMGVAKVLSSDLSGRGLVHYSMISSVVNLAVNLTANLLLVPKVGIVGAGIASSLSYSASGFIMTRAFMKECQVSPLSMFVVKREDLVVAADAFRRLVRRGNSA
ncbi:flippase [bacterium]|nr:flippase [bacterium]